MSLFDRVLTEGRVVLTEGVSVATLQAARKKAGSGPFRAPHYTASAKAMVGEVALANGGVLYLDSLADFSRSSIAAIVDALKAPRVQVVVEPSPDREKDPKAAQRWAKNLAMLKRMLGEDEDEASELTESFYKRTSGFQVDDIDVSFGPYNIGTPDHFGLVFKQGMSEHSVTLMPIQLKPMADGLRKLARHIEKAKLPRK